MVVFGDSNSDTGSRFNTPSSFQFKDDGIGAFPWKRLYDGPDRDVSDCVEKTSAYMPFDNSASNGIAWPTWLRIPDVGGAPLVETLFFVACCKLLFTLAVDYTHVAFIGANEMNRVIEAITRYSTGGQSYQDPVAFEKVFEVDATTGFPVLHESSLPVPTFAPIIEEVLGAWDEVIGRLIGAGITGRIHLANVGSPKGLAALSAVAGFVFPARKENEPLILLLLRSRRHAHGIAGTETGFLLDSVAQALRIGAQLLVAKYSPQV
ncbi:unnamed protein product [Ectocarpus sp. CCAP 1310/34]|nr:unnamed protein product [Ectocarpus sp. CCAP 1310/34]